MTALAATQDGLLSLFDKCTELREFTLQYGGIRTIKIKSYGALSGSRHTLSLSVDSMESWPIVKSIINRFSRVQKLLVKQNGDVRPDLMNEILEMLPQLTDLTVLGYSPVNMQRRDWAHLHCLNSLKSLSMSNITDIPASILKNKSKLHMLKLTNSNCGETILRAIGQYCATLTVLDLSGNEPIENSHVVTLLQDCIVLKVLTISDCSRITVDVLAGIKSESLQILIAHGTRIKKEILPQHIVASLTYQLVYAYN